ncbi:MAG: M15 family metallopeptidase, partial [Armatimonadota bacterium]|nr:M15 family metallopeptidase [Armatimonadota bacterium]
RRPLSSHSWGIAFDLNAATNPYSGEVSPENRALNEVFHRYGLAWGGDWAGEKDAMHWELADVEAWQRLSQKRTPRLIVAVQREHPPGSASFSYFAVPDAIMAEGQFRVSATKMAYLLSKSTSLGPSDLLPLPQVLQKLGAQLLQTGDHLQDAHDPRLYVFVKPG